LRLILTHCAFPIAVSGDLCRGILLQNALAPSEPNLKPKQIQTHIIGWENNERGKISLADGDADTQKVFGWKQKSFEIQILLKDFFAALGRIEP